MPFQASSQLAMAYAVEEIDAKADRHPADELEPGREGKASHLKDAAENPCKWNEGN